MYGIILKRCWPIMEDVMNLFAHFYANDDVLVDLNYTYIGLLPKIHKVNQMKDFQPIILRNLIYKLISKVLSNRLRSFLPSLIVSSKSAFVSGSVIPHPYVR